MKNRKWKKRLAAFVLFAGLAGCMATSFCVQASQDVAPETELTQEETTQEETTQTETTTEALTGKKKQNVTSKVTKKNQDISMEVSCGIDGFAAYDIPMVVRITVKSNENFNGYLQIIPEYDYGQNIVAYGEDIALTKGEEKTFSFVLSNISTNGYFTVSLLNEKDKVIYSEKEIVTLETFGDTVLMGVMSDDYSGLAYFDSVNINCAGYEQDINLLELSEKNFPEDSKAIDMLSYILIDNFDTAKLSEKQYNTLKEWVNGGGVLLVSLGANYQNVLHCFNDDFLTGTLGKIQKENISFALSDGPVSLEDVDVVDFSLDGGKALESFSADKAVYKKESGTGAVVVLSYDLSMEPFVSFEKRKEVCSALLEKTVGSNTINHLTGNVNTYSYDNSNDIAKITNDSKKPSTVLFGFVLIVYVIVVGPILYLFLKKINKQENLWLAIPATAMVFTVIIFLISLTYRVNKPLLNTFTVMQLGEGSKKEKVYTNVVCPKAKDYRIMLGEEYGNLMLRDNYSYNAFGSSSTEKKDNYYDMMVKKQNDGTQLVIHNTSTFKEKNFSLDRSGGNEIGSIDLDLHCYTTGFEGTVTNNTNCDLNNIVVNFEDNYYMIEELKKGESTEIDKDKLLAAKAYDTFYSMVANINNFIPGKKDKDLNTYYQINSFMENNYVRKDVYNQGCVWADVGSYTPELVKGASVKQYGRAVIYSTFASEYEDVSATYCPDIDQVVVSADGDYDSMERYIYSGAVTATYSFENYPDITAITNMSYDKTVDYGKYADVYAYNVETGNYDMIFTDSDTLSGEELKKYMAGNVMILRYEAADTKSSTYMPKISARGDE